MHLTFQSFACSNGWILSGYCDMLVDSCLNPNSGKYMPLKTDQWIYRNGNSETDFEYFIDVNPEQILKYLL